MDNISKHIRRNSTVTSKMDGVISTLVSTNNLRPDCGEFPLSCAIVREGKESCFKEGQ